MFESLFLILVSFELIAMNIAARPQNNHLVILQ